MFVQAVMVPLLGIDMEELRPEYAYIRIPFMVIVVGDDGHGGTLERRTISR
ncbi:hypothetical protein GCM10022226_11910 [Sphaerisporangium flaviroseum]|uniref:Uncharacterized protein n=1 Tax=Sphaerisporangium flaviroseum TaxID=509199 RepID=A0ABP7HGM4_9ACTN